MMHDLKRFAAGALALALLFTTGCGKSAAESLGTSQNPNAAAMGRYIETEYILPEKMGYVKNITRLEDGTIEMLGNLTPQMAVGPWYLFSSADNGKSWQQKDTPWLKEFEDTAINTVARDKSGSFYFYYVDFPKEILEQYKKGEMPPDDFTPEDKFIKADAAGTITQLSPDFPSGSRSAGVQSLSIAENGDYITNQYGSIIQADPATMKMKKEIVGDNYGTSLTSFTYGDTLLISDGDEITFYSLKTGEKTDSLNMSQAIGGSKDDKTAEIVEDSRKKTRLFAQAPDGSLYIGDETGIYRRVENGALLEKLVDGEMTSLNMPSLNYTDMVVGEQGITVFFTAGDVTGASGESRQRAMNYSYSAGTPTVPEKELKVYSLEDNKTIRQTMGLFQRANPDVHVVYTVGLSSASVTLSDALRTLSTELLAGKGPDLLVLDGMPMDSYIEKGVLLDLSPRIDPKAAAGELLSNMATALKQQDGKTYAVPARFSAPILVADDDVLASIHDLTTLADTHVKLKETKGDAYEAFIMAADPYSLFEMFYPICSPAWQNADGSVKEPEFRQFLTDLKKLYDLRDHKDDVPEDSVQKYNGFQIGGALSWAFELEPSIIANLNTLFDVSMPDAAITKKGKGRLEMLDTQTKKAFLPRTLLGVNANSPYQDVALNFLELVLSTEVQKNDFEDGMPVNTAAFDAQLKSPYSEFDDGMMYGMGSYDSDEVYELHIKWPTDAFMQTVADKLKALDTPCLPNAVVREMLESETRDFFTGAKTLDETVQAFMQKLNLYLSE